MKPTLTELERFEEAPEGIDLELGPETGRKDEGHGLATGDHVEVIEGELIHLQGKVIAIDGNKVTMMPKHEDLTVCFFFSLIFGVFRRKSFLFLFR